MLLSSLCRPCASSPLALSLASVWLRGWVFFILSKPRRFAKLHSACPDSHPKRCSLVGSLLSRSARHRPLRSPRWLRPRRSRDRLLRSRPLSRSALSLGTSAPRFALRAPSSLYPASRSALRSLSLCVSLRACALSLAVLALRLLTQLASAPQVGGVPPIPPLCALTRARISPHYYFTSVNRRLNY